MSNSARPYPEIISWVKSKRIELGIPISGVAVKCEELHARYLHEANEEPDDSLEKEKKAYQSNIPVPSPRTVQSIFAEGSEKVAFMYDISLQLIVRLFLELEKEMRDKEYGTSDSIDGSQIIIDEKNAAIEELKGEIEKLHNELSAERNKNEKISIQINSLTAQNNLLTQQNNQLDSAKTYVKEQNRDLKDQINRLLSIISSLTEKSSHNSSERTKE